MTIKEYMDNCKKLDTQCTNEDGILFSTAVGEGCEVWSNNACRGYFIYAAKAAGLDSDTIDKVLKTMKCSFEELSVDEADKIYIEY